MIHVAHCETGKSVVFYRWKIYKAIGRGNTVSGGECKGYSSE